MPCSGLRPSACTSSSARALSRWAARPSSSAGRCGPRPEAGSRGRPAARRATATDRRTRLPPAVWMPPRGPCRRQPWGYRLRHPHHLRGDPGGDRRAIPRRRFERPQQPAEVAGDVTAGFTAELTVPVWRTDLASLTNISARRASGASATAGGASWPTWRAPYRTSRWLTVRQPRTTAARRGRTREGPDPWPVDRAALSQAVPPAVARSSAGAGLLAGHLEGLVDLDGDALPAGGLQVGLVDAVGVGLHPQHGRPRVLGQGSRPDLAGRFAGEQLLVGSLALGLVDLGAGPRAGRGAVGPVGVGRAGGRGVGRAGRQRPHQHPARDEPAGDQARLGAPAPPAAALVGALHVAASLVGGSCRASRAILPARP